MPQGTESEWHNWVLFVFHLSFVWSALSFISEYQEGWETCKIFIPVNRNKWKACGKREEIILNIFKARGRRNESVKVGGGNPRIRLKK